MNISNVKMSEQKKITKTYFDDVAKDWFKRAYDPENKFLKFPTSKVRQNITISEMKRLNVGKKVIDLGCGTGQLVIELLKEGYEVMGIDNAPNMIAEARKILIKEFPTTDSLKLFQIKDVLNLDEKEKFDVVIAMGLLEYLEDDLTFFRIVKKLLDTRGYAFIECRNKLFNINSSNQYTLEAADSGDLKKLISQLDNIKKYSPTSIKQIWKIQKAIFEKIVKDVSNISEKQAEAQYEIPYTKEFPTTMIRRQHTPKELEDILKKVGLNLKYVVYYHCHPYLPRYEKLFPTIFNRLAFLMQPIGYTSLGGTICSSFVAVIEKQKS